MSADDMDTLTARALKEAYQQRIDAEFLALLTELISLVSDLAQAAYQRNPHATSQG